MAWKMELLRDKHELITNGLLNICATLYPFCLLLEILILTGYFEALLSVDGVSKRKGESWPLQK